MDEGAGDASGVAKWVWAVANEAPVVVEERAGLLGMSCETAVVL